jgi:hypothetical protein
MIVMVILDGFISNNFIYNALDFYKISKACLGGDHEGSAC